MSLFSSSVWGSELLQWTVQEFPIFWNTLPCVAHRCILLEIHSLRCLTDLFLPSWMLLQVWGISGFIVNTCNNLYSDALGFFVSFNLKLPFCYKRVTHEQLLVIFMGLLFCLNVYFFTSLMGIALNHFCSQWFHHVSFLNTKLQRLWKLAVCLSGCSFLSTTSRTGLLVSLVAFMTGSYRIMFTISIFSFHSLNNWTCTCIQGSWKTSAVQSSVDFLSGQVTFHSYLPDKQEIRQVVYQLNH